MKTIVMSLMSAVLIACLFLTPVSTVSASTGLASENCGDTYTIQYLDYLARIASYCGTTVANILALNPQIYNPNVIYRGQVLRLTSNVPIPSWPAPVPNYTGYSRVSLSTTWATAGSSVTVYVSGFPAYAEIDYRIGKQGEDFSVAYDGTTGAYGSTSQTITIPTSAELGEYWVVKVITTSLKDVTEINSYPIYIGQYNYYISNTGYARVSLSSVQTTAGGQVIVTVSGFPAYAEIDFRIGKQGADYSVVYDGTTGASGSTSQTITLPSGAVSGEYWVVKVLTTSLKTVTEVTSHTIYITD